MKISVSMLSTYLYCPRKLFLQKVLQVEEIPKESLVLGSIRHEVYDFINKAEENLVKSITEKPEYEKLREIYRQAYARKVREAIIRNRARIREVNLDIVNVFKRTWPYITAEAEERAQNIFNFIKEHNVYGDELWGKLIPKIISELSIESDTLQLKGIIDKVEIYKESYIPIELKTGKAPKEGLWPGHKIQIVAYALMLEEKYQKPIKEAFVHYLDNKEKRHITINPFMKEEIINLVKEIQELLEKKSLPNYCENRNKCVNCGAKETCYNEQEVDILMSEIH
ncbi:CRISPR-associated protein Cas4 [Candidatus Woesearchaeota archaeon]|nr:CRISPR-associated protein Cas4 [Candidatus Woesearchaeota archaeon]